MFLNSFIMQGTQAQEKKEMLAWFGIDDYNALPVMFRQGSSVFRVHIFCSSTEIPSTAFLNISYPKTKTLNDMNISCMIEKHLGAEKYWLIMPVAWISCFSLALKSNWWGSSWLFFRTNLEKKLWFDFNILVSLYVSYFYQDLFYRCLLISIIGRHSTLSYYYWLK